MPINPGLIDPISVGDAALKARQLMPDFAGDWLKQQQLALQRQEEARLLGAQRMEAKALAEQASAEDAYFANPNGQTYAKWLASNPKAHEGISAAHGAYSKTRPEYQQINSLYYEARNDRKAAAAKGRAMLDLRRDPNGVLPEEDEDDEDIFAALDRDDDPQANQWALGAMAAAAANASGDPKAYWETHDKAFPPAELIERDGLFYKEGPGGIPVLVGQAKERVRTNPDGTHDVLPQLIDVPVIGTEGPGLPTRAPPAEGGEGPPPETPGTPARSGEKRVRRIGGWTPRARDGGDNSDKAVDNKLGVMQKQTGFAPDAALTLKDMPTLFDAITATEGGVATRARNPGNIKDGDWARAQPGYVGAVGGKGGRFAKFNTVAAGRAAGIKLLANKFNAGHRTMRDIIEGRPEGRGARSQQAQPSNAVRRPRSLQEAIALPKGTRFVKPGETRVRIR